tara:strand:- start:1916 stop:2518 length:603 start_codon:yes stop_codon:yes gene_type:complete
VRGSSIVASGGQQDRAQSARPDSDVEVDTNSTAPGDCLTSDEQHCAVQSSWATIMIGAATGGQQELAHTVDASSIGARETSFAASAGAGTSDEQHDAEQASSLVVIKGTAAIWDGGSAEPSHGVGQQSSGPANAASDIRNNPPIPMMAGLIWRCLFQPGTNARRANRRQIPTIHLWKAGSARKLRPRSGRKPITNGIAAQ